MQHAAVPADSTYRFNVESCGRIMQQDDKLDVYEKFATLPFAGKVKLGDPDTTFGIILLHERLDGGASKQLVRCYFGRLVARASRDIIERYSLKRRTHIGPTSTDAELAFLMANMGHVCCCTCG
jgi:tRNA (guanine10-N2)-methyltransferase